MNWFKKKVKTNQVIAKAQPPPLVQEPPAIPQLYFACIHCGLYGKNCKGTYDDFCDNFVKFESNQKNYNPVACPHCNSTNTEKTYSDRFHCRNCGQIFN